MDFGPGVHEVDVGFSARPGQAGGITGQRIGEIANIDSRKTRGKGVDVDARDTDGGGVVLAVIGIRGDIVVVRHAKPDLRDQRGANHAVPAKSRAKGLLYSGAFKCAAAAVSAVDSE